MQRVTIEEAKSLPPVISSGEASAITGICTHKITNMLARGEIKGVKVGRRWFVDAAALLKQFGIEG